MPATSTIPCTISPDVTAKAAEFGVEHELHQMLDYALRCIPSLCRVDVSLREPMETIDDPRIVIDAFVASREGEPLNPGEDAWEKWALKTFSADVLRHIVLLLWDEPADERQRFSRRGR